jgi:hypothetical protein
MFARRPGAQSSLFLLSGIVLFIPIEKKGLLNGNTANTKL